MKTHTCACGQIVFFENLTCVACNQELGFLPDLHCLSSLEKASGELYSPTAEKATGKHYRKCQNYAQASVCNWMIPAESADAFCVSCRLNLMIPDQSVPENVVLWGLTEAAKRRLIYSCLRLNLPVANRTDDPNLGLGFQFLADTTQPDGTVERVVTAHDHGLITLNIAEADDAAREKIRLGMKEPYRTLLGHFRHESGHYYWDRLVLHSQFLEPFRTLFGDDRQDYAEAAKKYYDSAPSSDWQENFISRYATMHSWEDWAESWAHYLHIQDALEVAADFGLVGRRVRIEPLGKADGTSAPPQSKIFDQALEAWAELTVVLNSINRSMGQRDLYPFVLSQRVVEKLRFVSKVIAGTCPPAKTPAG